jgi:hypothetical protein
MEGRNFIMNDVNSGSGSRNVAVLVDAPKNETEALNAAAAGTDQEGPQTQHAGGNEADDTCVQQGIEVEVYYGLGASCHATIVPRPGMTIREFVHSVIDAEQSSEEAKRTAKVLRKLMGTERELDVGVRRGKAKPNQIEQPVDLNDVLISEREMNDPGSKTFTIGISKPLKGGAQ